MLIAAEGIVSDNILQDETPIPGEVLAAIVAAATVFLGKKLRIRGIAELRQMDEKTSRWTRQGRVLVQTSHNLALKHPQKAH